MKKLKPEPVAVALRAPRYAGYADCVLGTSVSVELTNGGAETLSADVSLECVEGLFAAYSAHVEIPFERAAKLDAAVFSPLFLSEIEEPTPCEAVAAVSVGGREVAHAAATVTALPFDVWEGLSGNAERLAVHVRPHARSCSETLSDAAKRIRRWNKEPQAGYANADKNGVRRVCAAIYSSLRAIGLSRKECDLQRPVRAFRDGIPRAREATPLELGVYACACLEAAGLHPVLAVGKGVGAGVWLYDSCFLDPVTDDAETVSKYVAEGVNHLCFFDIEDLFSGKNATFSASEGHFARKLREGEYGTFVDVRRCRIGGIAPLPIRERGERGVELFRGEEAPAPLPVSRPLPPKGQSPANCRWERRLLDLTFKNPLLDFTGKNALHLVSADADRLFSRLSEGEGLRLKAEKGDAPPFGASASGQRRELSDLEERQGVLRVYSSPEALSETATRLLRRNREAEEETGARVLYVAFGFLRFSGREEKQPRRAPLVLAPALLRRAKGSGEFSLSCENEFLVNATLLEFLKQDRGVDIRGLNGAPLTIAEIFAAVRGETAEKRGWDVTEDVYAAAFSFQRYLMWNDVRRHMDELGKNRLVSALLTGRGEWDIRSAPEEDEDDPARVLLPLPADSSQYSAISLAKAGASFVLHGPPGTGKSQTIANIISNALADGKRVLFVAEKRAALDVVKKRLDAVGIGDFCLELHGGKAEWADVLRRIEHTISLPKEGDGGGFFERAAEIAALREELAAPVRALREKRSLGLSVYQAILLYLQNRDAPDVLEIEGTFYASLTEEKLLECRRMICDAAAAAKACGGVFRSPFENVGLTEYSRDVRDRVYCACETLIAEIGHAKALLGIFLEFYRQRAAAVTEESLLRMAEVAERLASGRYDRYFRGADAEVFRRFFRANRTLDARREYYFRHFSAVVGSDRAAEELAALCAKGGDWKLCRAARATVKKLCRVARHEMREEDVPKYLSTLADMREAERQVRACGDLAAPFCGRSGRIRFKKREEFLADLYGLHRICGELFPDFNADAFNEMCVRAANGSTSPALRGFVRAAESCRAAIADFSDAIRADGERCRGETLDGYAAKAGALMDNIDMLPGRCMYGAMAEKLSALGLNFVTEALESGKLRTENVLAGFEKNVCKNFLELTIPSDPALARLAAGTMEETAEKFRLAWDEFSALARRTLRERLLARLPAENGTDGAAKELALFARLSKGNLRGTGLRGLFSAVPSLLSAAAPCLLMSPVTVAQYLRPAADLFDLVVFDEASQMSTAEAVGAIARAKQAIVVGDPKQLPPTSFFRSAYADEEEDENEDLESVLDDCLALGMPQRHLIWHYRSRHESLIAFSNNQYYENRLCTFPSPDGSESRVRLIPVEGVYERGAGKRNRAETEALVAEVIRRLSDPVLSRFSMGIVTFSGAQRDDIERVLTAEIAKRGLGPAAYEREEPLFVKNLENVQGDERDVILFSVCYGPDAAGRVSLNFGPLNQAGGWRRLNVAVSRAREEMLVFSTLSSPMIDLSRTSSEGVAGLKAFLEFAERGKTTLAVGKEPAAGGSGFGKYLARELEKCGYECRCDVGASAFKVDVAVVDPADSRRFLLGVLCGDGDEFSVKDRTVLQVRTMKRAGWNLIRVGSVGFYNNPKREVKRVKDLLDRLTGADRSGAWLSKCQRPYRSVRRTGAETAAFVTGGERDDEIRARLKEIVSTEEPISRAFLRKRLLGSFGIARGGSKVDARLDALIDACAFPHERAAGVEYFYKNPRALAIGKTRVERGNALRRTEEDFTVFEVVSLIKSALDDKIALYLDEVASLAAGVFGVRPSERFSAFVNACVSYGEEKGLFVRSLSDRLALA